MGQANTDVHHLHFMLSQRVNYFFVLAVDSLPEYSLIYFFTSMRVVEKTWSKGLDAVTELCRIAEELFGEIFSIRE